MRRPGGGGQTATDALGTPDGDGLYRLRAAKADKEETRRRAIEREARRPVCTGCGAKFTDDRWKAVRGWGRPPGNRNDGLRGPCVDAVSARAAEAERAVRQEAEEVPARRPNSRGPNLAADSL
ncbi:hypothetical protein ACFU8Q_22100 [Streptomyces sp. NPDC057543]|uniref:hypothetical protein n=1 Tax=Streptomyces sp. NPDC057543 TaxID=3346163 RepID=UPI0036778C80